MDRLRSIAIALFGHRACPSPGCPELMHVFVETRVWRCPMHGPMAFADEEIERRLAPGPPPLASS